MDRFQSINILINVDESYLPKAEYVINTYCHILKLSPKFHHGTTFEKVHIYYGIDNGNPYPLRIHYTPESAGFYERKEIYPSEKVNFVNYKGEFIPFIFSLPGQIFAFDDNHGMIRKDIIASGFYFLSCWREHVLGNQGSDRFDFNKSVQKYWDFTETPVVDVYCEILQKMLELFLIEFMRITTWQEDKRFAVSISHDIDYWNFWTKEHQNYVFRYNLNRIFRQPINALYKAFSHTIDKQIANNPYKKMKQLVKKEEKKGVVPTYFLFTKTDFQDPRMNYFGNPEYRNDIKNLLGKCDIALHGSQESAFNGEILQKEWDNLLYEGYDAIGYRAHSLSFHYQNSFNILEKIGACYDATLGYWEHIGFRAGISFPFYPYNIAENRPFRVLEIPLIVMDTTLLSAKAMNLSTIQAFRRIKRLIHRANLFKSHISILWHNTTFDPIDFPGWGPLYWKIIKEVKHQGGWLCSLRQVYEYWLK
jgi:hypothetical protein